MRWKNQHRETVRPSRLQANLIAVAGFPTLAGAGAGVRVQWQWGKQLLSGELLVGRALVQPAALGSKPTLVLGTANWWY